MNVPMSDRLAGTDPCVRAVCPLCAATVPQVLAGSRVGAGNDGGLVSLSTAHGERPGSPAESLLPCANRRRQCRFRTCSVETWRPRDVDIIAEGERGEGAASPN